MDGNEEQLPASREGIGGKRKLKKTGKGNNQLKGNGKKSLERAGQAKPTLKKKNHFMTAKKQAAESRQAKGKNTDLRTMMHRMNQGLNPDESMDESSEENLDEYGNGWMDDDVDTEELETVTTTEQRNLEEMQTANGQDGLEGGNSGGLGFKNDFIKASDIQRSTKAVTRKETDHGLDGMTSDDKEANEENLNKDTSAAAKGDANAPNTEPQNSTVRNNGIGSNSQTMGTQATDTQNSGTTQIEQGQPGNNMVIRNIGEEMTTPRQLQQLVTQNTSNVNMGTGLVPGINPGMTMTTTGKRNTTTGSSRSIGISTGKKATETQLASNTLLIGPGKAATIPQEPPSQKIYKYNVQVSFSQSLTEEGKISKNGTFHVSGCFKQLVKQLNQFLQAIILQPYNTSGVPITNADQLPDDEIEDYIIYYHNHHITTGGQLVGMCCIEAPFTW